jgi:cyclic pyranopterin phosphate synthase
MTPFDVAHHSKPATTEPTLIDGFGRTVRYLRVSVTDRCDLRCVYCMAEHMVFLPKAEVLTLEELDQIASSFVELGVKKLRLTGGEPLVRKGFLGLVENLSRHLKSGALEELTLTTNGTRLAHFAKDLARFGVKRINVSLDSLDPVLFKSLTRGGDLAQVMAGLDAADAAGLAVKINVVALKDTNEAEIPAMISWAHGRGYDLTLIETMPLGDTGEDRTSQFLSLAKVRETLSSFWTLTDIPLQTGGPARYVRIEETGGRLGLITPMSHTFCEACNRVRLTCTGVLHTCLGHEDEMDLRAVLRGPKGPGGLEDAIRLAIAGKPEGHDFHISEGSAPTLARHMSRTGG